MQRFDSKTVIVTGGGSGIGRATALAFAQEGANVVVADIDQAGGRETVAAIEGTGGKARFTATDVNSGDSVDALVETTVETYGGLDVYFSNAGAFDSFTPCEQTGDDLWSRILGINLSGCFYGARAALPHLMKTKGNIVMTVSIAGLGAQAGGVAYTASKFGVVGLINQLACENAAHGVRVNGVAPGPVRTNMMGDASVNLDVEQWIKTATPMGRFALAEEIARPVLFLASDDASFITGTLLRVDGGWRSK